MEILNNLVSELENPYKLEKPKMRECYIAYLDMLGYKAFFKENPDKIEGLLDAINVCFECAAKRLRMFNTLFSVEKFKIRGFSDNILIYYEVEKNYESKFVLISFIEIIKDIQFLLILKYGIFLRGGITKGNFAANDMFVFGEGLIDAVILEDKKAKNPRIIIDNKVIEDIKESQQQNPYVCQLCRELKDVSGLFKTSSNNELLGRILNAYQTFDTIVLGIPDIYCKVKEKENIRKGLNKIVNFAKVGQGNRKILEMNYENIKKILPNMSKLFARIANEKMAQLEKLNEIRAENVYFIDDDKYATIDYLSIPDISSVFNPQMLTLVVKNMKITLAKFPEMWDEINIYFDKNERNKCVKKRLLVHKKAVSAEIATCMDKYFKSKDAKDFSTDDKVIKKYIWSMNYHNLVCDKEGNVDLKINSKLGHDANRNFTTVEIIDE